MVLDKAVEFVKGNEGLFTEEIDKATVDKLENKDLKYSMIIKDIERYANQITSFRATIDTIEEISGNDGECLTVMKVHYKRNKFFANLCGKYDTICRRSATYSVCDSIGYSCVEW